MRSAASWLPRGRFTSSTGHWTTCPVISAGQAPADNDPLTDVGPGEPVAHAGHLFRGSAARAAASLATTPLPAGDVAGDADGVVGQRAGLRGAAGQLSRPDNLAFSAVNRAHCPGTSLSQKIASTRQTRSQAPQSVQSPGWM